MSKKSYILPAAVLVVVLLWSIFWGGDSIMVDFDTDRMSVAWGEEFRVELEYDELLRISLADMPEEGTLLSGGESRHEHYGERRNEVWGDYTLCMTDKSDKCIVLETEDRIFVFSYESTESTELTYESFRELLLEQGYDVECDP